MPTTNRTVEVTLGTSSVDASGRPQRRPLAVSENGTMVALEPPPPVEPELEGEHMLINIGPQHPAPHEVLRLVLELERGTVVRCFPLMA